MTQTFVESSAQTQNSKDDVTHTTCCKDEDIALCGIDVSDLPWQQTTEDEVLCDPCEDMMDQYQEPCTAETCIVQVLHDLKNLSAS